MAKIERRISDEALVAITAKAATVESGRNFRYTPGVGVLLVGSEEDENGDTVIVMNPINDGVVSPVEHRTKLQFALPFTLDKDGNPLNNKLDGKVVDLPTFLTAMATGIVPVESDTDAFQLSGKKMESAPEDMEGVIKFGNFWYNTKPIKQLVFKTL